MSDTYTKLFRSIAASTIVSEPLATRWLWIFLISQANRSGVVFGSIPGIARMANITIAEAEAALTRFMSPDPYSRTADHEGRRVEAVDGGWRLLNYGKYDAMRSEAERREYKRQWDRKNRPSGHQRAKVSGSPEGAESDSPTAVRQSDHSPTETRQSVPMSHVSCPMSQEELESPDGDLSPAEQGDPSADDSTGKAKSRPSCPHQRIVDLYHEVLPELRQVRQWNDTRRRLLARRWSESPERQTLDWWREFFGYVRQSRFLMGQTTGRDGRPFDCDLEWLIRPSNFAKVIEGKYEEAVA